MKMLAGAALLLAAVPAAAQQPTLRDPLLDRLEGRWVTTGTVAGEGTSMAVTATWTLAHQYLRVDQVTREREADGRPKYQATVFIGWNAKTQTYGCVWLDDFGGLNTQSIGAAPKRDGSLPFVFTNLDGTFTRTTMTWDAAAKGWTWTIDEDRAGKLSRFATLTLRRAPAGKRRD